MRHSLLFCFISFTIAFVGCSKNGVGDPNNPSGADTISNASEAGQVLFYNSSSSTREMYNVFNGTLISSWPENIITGTPPSTIDSNLMYLAGQTYFAAINLANGNTLYRKFFLNNSVQTSNESYPLIKDSIVYFVSFGENLDTRVFLHAYNKSTGVNKFSTMISSGGFSTMAHLATPVILGNNIYVTFSESIGIPTVYCINNQTGVISWSKALGNKGFLSSFPVFHNNTLLVSLSSFPSHKIFGLEPTTGNILFQTTNQIQEYTTIDRKIINNALYSFSGDNGKTALTTVNLNSGIIENSFIFDSHLFFLDNESLYYLKDGTVNKYSLQNKSVEWSKEMAAETFRKKQSDPNNILVQSTSPVVTDKYIYIMEAAGYNTQTLMASIVIYNKESGKQVYELKNFVYSPYVKFIIKNASGKYFYPFRGLSY